MRLPFGTPPRRIHLGNRHDSLIPWPAHLSGDLPSRTNGFLAKPAWAKAGWLPHSGVNCLR